MPAPIPNLMPRWRELDARRPHAVRLTPEERREFERLDQAVNLRRRRKV